MPSEAAVELVDLSKAFPLPWSRRRVVALSGLELRVKRGEVVGLLGPNGSGKSTTMKLITGLLRADSGTVQILGEAGGSLRSQARIGYLPESPQFPAFLTAKELVTYYGRLCGMRGDRLRKRVGEVLEWVRLGGAADRALRTYSKGMLQRVGLAQALVHDPEVIVLDEPTAGVDPVGAHEFRGLMGALRDQGKTVLYSSHLLGEVEAVADRVVMLHRGRKVLEGQLEEILRDDERWELLLAGGGGSDPSVREELVGVVNRWSLERGQPVQAEWVPHRRSLEEVYRAKVGSEQTERGETV